MASYSPDTPPRVSKQNSTGQISSQTSGLGRGQSPYFKMNSFTFPNLANDLTADQKTVKRSSSADDPPQTAGQSPPPKPPRKKSPRPQSKLADHSSQATNGAGTSPSSSPPQPPRQTDSSRPSTDDTVYLPPASKHTASSNYDSLLPKQKGDVYDHLGPTTTDLASLLPNTMSRYRTEAKQKPDSGAKKELRSASSLTEYPPSNSTELPVNEGPKASKVIKNGEMAGPTNLPWRKLPRVDIKDEPEVHAWRNLRSSATEPSLSPTRDIEYSMEPRNFSQAFHVPKNQCSLKTDPKIEEEEEEEEEKDEMIESNAEQQEPSADEPAVLHPAMSLGGVPDMRMDLEYSMEPRMYAFRNQQTALTMPLAENRRPKKKRKDGERKKKRKETKEVSEKKDNEEKLAEEKGDIKVRLTEDKVKDIEATDQDDKKLPRIEEELEKDKEEPEQTAKEVRTTERAKKKKKGAKQVKEAREDDDGSRKTSKTKRKSKSEARASKTSQESSTAAKEEKQLETDKPQVEQEVPPSETQEPSTAHVKSPVENKDKSEALQSKTQDSPRTNKQETAKTQVNANDRLLLEVAERKRDDSANEQIEDHRQLLVEHTPSEETSRRERERSADTTSTPIDSSPEPQSKPSPKHDLSPSHFTLPVGSSSPLRHRSRSGSYGEADSLKSRAASMVKSRQRKTVYGLASPSGSFGTGTEDSIGWGAMSVTDYEQQLAPYVAKPGDAPPSRSKWLGFKKSLMGEKKPHSIFNPKNKEKLIKYLVNPKVDVNATNDAGQTALHSYVHSDRPDKLELLVTLLSHCNCKLLNIDAPDRYGNSPLLVAVEMNDFPSVKALLAFGANINCPNTFGETPLDRVFKQLQYGDRDDLHDLFCRLHAVQGKGIPSPASNADQEPLNESINSIVNESHEIEEDQRLGLYLEPKRLTAFVFKLEEMMKRHDLEFSVNTKLSIPVGFQDHNQTFFDPMIARQSQLLRISEWKSTLDFNLGAGSRMLVLDGGGIRGLIEIEILEKIEKLTGRRIIELFDWIVGTSTGGILALGLVYLGLTLPELRQMYFRMREEVLCGGVMSTAKKTDALEHLLKSNFGNINMRDKEFPKVMIGAVSTKQNPPLLHFFNNCFNDEFSGHLVWKVARYTSAGPGYFTECDRYMDGGVMANNPSLAAWTDISRICAATSIPPPRITMVVSLGTGVFPPEQMGSTDILGKGRLLDLRGTFRRVHRFIKMLATALSESETVASAFKATCDASGIKFFRFSPTLTSVIGPDEIDPLTVVDMLMLVKEYLSIQSTQQSLDEMVKLFRHISDISRGLNLEK